MKFIYHPHWQDNIAALEQLLDWTITALELKLDFSDTEPYTLAEPPLWKESMWANVVDNLNLPAESCIALGLALIPELRPQALAVLSNALQQNKFAPEELGGINGKEHLGILPTKQTFAFLLSDSTSEGNYLARQILRRDGDLIKLGILLETSPQEKDPELTGVLRVTAEFFHILTQGTPYVPQLSTSFPAELITTEMTWDDLVLPEKTLFQLEEIISWFKGKDNLLNNPEVKKLLRPGYRAIFHGPSGTGKTLSAQLLAKRMGLPLLKVHTPMLVSKWVGETEKNLNRLFDQASGRDWILLFDEGENLFGQRGGNSTQDQHSNQQIGFLLQKIEHHDGLIIISSNRYASMDPAFRRRFESIVRFKEPTYEERLKLWQNIFGKVEIDQREVKFEELAEHYPDMTGGYLINVLRSAWTWAYQSDRDWIKLVDILRGIQKETHKIRSGWTVKPPEENAGLTPYLDSDVWI